MTQYNLICSRLAPAQLNVATPNSTFIFCYIDFKQKANDAQNSQFLSNETGKAVCSIGLWWIPLLGNFHGILIFPPEALYGCPTVEIQCKILAIIIIMEQKFCINRILYLNIISGLCRSEIMCKLITLMANLYCHFVLNAGICSMQLCDTHIKINSVNFAITVTGA
jgi:hypothetical protein